MIHPSSFKCSNGVAAVGTCFCTHAHKHTTNLGILVEAGVGLLELFFCPMEIAISPIDAFSHLILTTHLCVQRGDTIGGKRAHGSTSPEARVGGQSAGTVGKPP